MPRRTMFEKILTILPRREIEDLARIVGPADIKPWQWTRSALIELITLKDCAEIRADVSTYIRRVLL